MKHHWNIKAGKDNCLKVKKCVFYIVKVRGLTGGTVMFVRILVTLVVLFGLFTFNGCKKTTTTTTPPPDINKPAAQ